MHKVKWWQSSPQLSGSSLGSPEPGNPGPLSIYVSSYLVYQRAPSRNGCEPLLTTRQCLGAPCISLPYVSYLLHFQSVFQLVFFLFFGGGWRGGSIFFHSWFCSVFWTLPSLPPISPLDSLLLYACSHVCTLSLSLSVSPSPPDFVL